MTRHALKALRRQRRRDQANLEAWITNAGHTLKPYQRAILTGQPGNLAAVLTQRPNSTKQRLA